MHVLYYDHSTCIMSYKAHVRRNWDRGIQGPKPPGKQGGGGPPSHPSDRVHRIKIHWWCGVEIIIHVFYAVDNFLISGCGWSCRWPKFMRIQDFPSRPPAHSSNPLCSEATAFGFHSFGTRGNLGFRHARPSFPWRCLSCPLRAPQ